MISYRTLRNWRRDALKERNKLDQSPNNVNELCDRILRLTQELLDQHLLRKV
jgi:hypothetical protein